MIGKDVQSWFVEFSQALLAETELSELLDFVLTFTVKQAQADGGSLLLLDEAKGELIPKASLGLVSLCRRWLWLKGQRRFFSAGRGRGEQFERVPLWRPSCH